MCHILLDTGHFDPYFKDIDGKSILTYACDHRLYEIISRLTVNSHLLIKKIEDEEADAEKKLRETIENEKKEEAERKLREEIEWSHT